VQNTAPLIWNVEEVWKIFSAPRHTPKVGGGRGGRIRRAYMLAVALKHYSYDVKVAGLIVFT